MAIKAFYCVGTHWDREWYKPFQEYRMWLVELIDEAMDLMDRDPDYRCFHLDGQTIVLEDYLDIRPERRERLLGFLRERRLLAGPWYNLPDEWLVSGESLVRNLLRGLRICREMGFPHLDFAYTPDQFGHIAALPMIMTGFGLRAGIVWRGTQDEHYPTQFVWVGPDGSRMVYHKLSDKGSYSPFDFFARRPVKAGDFSDESFQQHFEPYFKEECERAPLPYLLLLDAIDHQRPDPVMPRLLEELRQRYPETEFVWGSIEDYGREIAARADELPERTGELREPVRHANRGPQYLIVHTISSRYDIKKRNDECQTLMERWAEPCALLEQMAGGEPIVRYLDKAWEYLLKNHPHDSICGCSIDQVHRDMHYRFDQCGLIADGVVRRAISRLGHASDGPDTWKNVVVHNPLPYARSGVYDLTLFFPSDYGKDGYAYLDGLATGEVYNKFTLVNKAGRELPYQHVRIERGLECMRLNELGREQVHVGDLYHVAVELDLPPCGQTAFQIQPTLEATRNFGSLRVDSMAASNGVIGFELRPDGTGMMVHHDTGELYGPLFHYEDCGDGGDGWTRGIPTNDVVYRGPGASVMTAIDEDGPLRTTFRVEREFLLPRMLDRKTGWRSEDRKNLRVTDFISVEKGAPYLRVRTVVHNTLKDHRFRVLFQTHLDSERSFAGTPFAMVERDIAIPPETARCQERVNAETAFTGIFGVGGENGGLAVLVPHGLHEYEVTETADRSLALTLFRSFFKTVMKPAEKDGELQGTLEFEYLLYPFAERFDPTLAWLTLTGVQTGIRAHTAATLPETSSRLSLVDGNLVPTSLKPAEDGVGGIIRFWNPRNEPANDRLWIPGGARECHVCNLNEEPQSRLKCGPDGIVSLHVKAGGLLTVRFIW
jgi:alpha-mannosidase/mannosylglycerate hydrolase